MRKRHRIFTIIFIILFCPTICYALYHRDPYAYIGVPHFIIGCLLIAILEKKVVLWIFKEELKLIPLILANYISAFYGEPFVTKIVNANGWNFSTQWEFVDTRLYMYMYILLFFFLSFIFSFFIELPFYYFASDKEDGDRDFFRSIKNCLIANLVSFIFVSIIYILFTIFMLDTLIRNWA